MTSYQKHKKRWENCIACHLRETRDRVVLARGFIPSDILFIGEAPGISEDTLGRPFVGPAGKLLDRIIEQAIDGQWDYAITNLVGCIPKQGGDKLSEPPKECIDACAGRLQEFVEICKPELIVRVGRLASDYTLKSLDCSASNYKWVDIIHPAAILRMDVSKKGLAIQRTIVTLSDAVGELA